MASTTGSARRRSPSPESLRGMRFAPSSPRASEPRSAQRSPPPSSSSPWSPPWSPSSSRTTPTASSLRKQKAKIDYPPRAALHWDDEETVPRAQFDAYVRRTERALAQLQATVDGQTSQGRPAAAQERRIHELECGLHAASQEMKELRREIASLPPELRLHWQWEDSIQKELDSTNAAVESLRTAVSEQSVARDAQLTAIEQALRRLQRASVPHSAPATSTLAGAGDESPGLLLARAKVQATADAKARKHAETTVRKLEYEKDAAEADAEAARELLRRVEWRERDELALAADLAYVQQQMSPALTLEADRPLDNEKRLQRIWRSELATTERELSYDVDLLRSRNQELEQQLAATTATPSGAAKKEPEDDNAIPMMFPTAPKKQHQSKRTSCVVHVGGLEGEDLEDEAKLSVR